MKIRVRYESTNALYSDHEQTFVGPHLASCLDQMDEYEMWLAKTSPGVYKSQIIEPNEPYAEINIPFTKKRRRRKGLQAGTHRFYRCKSRR